jgi:high-affinity iron transporter
MAMLAALVIVFREVLEAGLIIGVVLAASRGVPGRGRIVMLGILTGVAGSAVVAAFAAQITSAFEGRGQELFTAAVLILAVLMLAWHVIWMAEHTHELTSRLRQLGHDVALGSRSVAALGTVVALAVMREGSEVVLFLMGIVLQSTEGAVALALGAAGGLALGAGVSAGVYLGLAAVPVRHLFTVTSVLVTLLAAGLAAQAVQQLASAGLVSFLDSTLWDSTWLLSEDSWPGRVLHVLVGYMDRPSLLQGIVYVVTAATIFVLGRSRRTLKPARASSREAGLGQS